MACFWPAMILFIIISSAVDDRISVTEASMDIGVCYGMLGDNLPPASDVINLFRKYNIGKLRLFDPNVDALNALKGSEISVTLGIRNEDTPNLAASQDATNSWFATYVQPFIDDVLIPYIAVGNEIIPSEYASSILPAMQNLQKILDDQNLHGIKVTTVVSLDVLGVSFPPSNGAFSPEASATLTGILQFLSTQGSPLMLNVYPYFAYANDPVNIRLDYAQFTATSAVIVDQGLSYFNLFDAMVDTVYWAMEKLGVGDVGLVVSESGWPSAGNGNFTTPQLAATYNQNFVRHVLELGKGTPKRPGAYIEGFIFAMFNENLKPAGVEQNFGLFYPNMQPVYNIF